MIEKDGSLANKVDNVGKHCKKCNEGHYVEYTFPTEETIDILHCSFCKHRIARYAIRS